MIPNLNELLRMRRKCRRHANMRNKYKPEKKKSYHLENIIIKEKIILRCLR
jgi:hypothetical protein